MGVGVVWLVGLLKESGDRMGWWMERGIYICIYIAMM